MINIILFGPPGSGKGTQASKLKDRYKLLHISTGDIFRSEISNKTELGLAAKKYMDEGKLVPDDVTIGMLAKFLDSNYNPSIYKGIIFDGFPRTIPQAEALDKLLSERKMPVNKVLSLEVEDEDVVKRIILRGASSGRSDDMDEGTVRKRLQVYKDQTSPLKGHYTHQKKLAALNGAGTIDEVFEQLRKEMDKL
jgi:adenylate kinase